METMDRNSTRNQEIKGKFVGREVLTCFSYEMDAVIEANILSYDDIENGMETVCPNCSNDLEQNIIDELDEGKTPRCPDCDEVIDPAISDITQPQEIYEWWIVTDYLHRKLKEKGQPVLEWGNNCYWGRCCTGQSILLDGVISDICQDMEILEGMKYEWK